VGREDDRLAALEGQLDPVSRAVIGQLRLAEGWRCWEAGAGGGSMAAWLARQVADSGSVLATDIDISGLSGLRCANITVARHDLEREDVPSGEFDLIHARLVLEHLREPAAVVGQAGVGVAGRWLARPRRRRWPAVRCRTCARGLRGDHRAMATGGASRWLEPVLRPGPGS